MGKNASWPAADTVTINAGKALAGKTIKLRFRLGTGVAAEGSLFASRWNIDNVAFKGIANTPFPLISANAAPCNGAAGKGGEGGAAGGGGMTGEAGASGAPGTGGAGGAGASGVGSPEATSLDVSGGCSAAGERQPQKFTPLAPAALAVLWQRWRGRRETCPPRAAR